mmetsp:Transcript_50674/g.100851  ORF Transcript_50674/g.100851 Transcript_50674/m.100851 type:complete len:82 (-) Transcript_50674:364-609(-)
MYPGGSGSLSAGNMLCCGTGGGGKDNGNRGRERNDAALSREAGSLEDGAGDGDAAHRGGVATCGGGEACAASVACGGGGET